MYRAGVRSPIVFAAVTDPVKAGVVAGFGRPTANVTGASDLAPLAEQMRLFVEIVPGMKRMGFVFDSRLISPAATLAALRPIADSMGVSIVEAPVESAAAASEAVVRLMGKVDAIYLPNDTTVNPATASIVRLSHGAKVPVFTSESNGVDREGALASVGLDYFEVGALQDKWLSRF